MMDILERVLNLMTDYLSTQVAVLNTCRAFRTFEETVDWFEKGCEQNEADWPRTQDGYREVPDDMAAVVLAADVLRFALHMGWLRND